MNILLLVCLALVVFPCIIAGIATSVKHDDLGQKLNDWPRRKPQYLYDRHGAIREDDAFVDGMITGAVLDDLDDMFK